MRDDARRTPRDIDEDNAAPSFHASQAIRIFPGLWRTLSILFFLLFFYLSGDCFGGPSDVEALCCFV